jgi:hypothetical protein
MQHQPHHMKTSRVNHLFISYKLWDLVYPLTLSRRIRETMFGNPFDAASTFGAVADGRGVDTVLL